jgi:hypothetical protein
MAEHTLTHRTITRICAAARGDGGPISIYALCDDGTVWHSKSTSAGSPGWALLPPIPQPEPLGVDE